MFFIIKTFRKLIVLSSLMKWNSVCISAQQIITFTLKGRGYYDYQGEVISYRFLDVVNQNIQKILYQAGTCNIYTTKWKEEAHFY